MLGKAICREGYKFIIEKLASNIVSLTAQDETTGASFSIDKVELARINSQTIITALNASCDADELRQDEKQISIEFIVQLEYLPKITEKLTLPKQEGKAQLKAEFMEIRRELHRMEETLNQINLIDTTIIKMDGYMANQQIKRDCKKGLYLLEISGFVNTTEQIYDEYNQGNDCGSFLDCMQLAISTKEGDKVEKKTVRLLMNSGQSYQYPFSYTAHINFTTDGQLQIKVINNRTPIYFDTATFAVLTPVISALI